ncbi:hypothetical protein VTH82DRAFT_6474 [Thermothelomyces myriococcoides]
MFRPRRHRVVLICAFVITVLLYHVSKNSQWDQPGEKWRGKTSPDSHPRPESPPPPPPPHVPPPAAPPPADQESGVRIPQLKDADQDQPSYGLPTEPAAVVPERKPPAHHDNYPDAQAEDVGFRDPAIPSPSIIHWQKPYEWFPVPEESLIPLPTGKPKPIPSVQFSFGQESPAAKERREERLARVRAEALHAWSGYKEYAWTHDELMPVTNKSRDPFCGWAATLVDSLDTLWIMGLKDEFDEAVDAVGEIDFTTTPYRDEIPVFETIIRYLGGLLGAYDVTGNDPRYSVLLDKAVELAEILMGVFDTPNRLPILFYNWKPDFAERPKRASTAASVAELGSMSLEFTRLAQLTGEDKYYDAIARITDAFEELQNRENGTAIPGIFPERLDASGCNRTAPVPSSSSSETTAADSANVQHGADGLKRELAGRHEAPSTEDSAVASTGIHDKATNEPQKRAEGPTGGDQPSVNVRELPPSWECVAQPLVGSSWGTQSYSMGGCQDSTYEYFPKEYLLLGGLEPKYRTMHEKTVDAVKEYLLFRPMAEGDPDILFSAKAYSPDGTADKLTYDWEVTHLTCFLGGMFGLGGRIFDRPEDVEIAKKLTDGCVWAYDVMPTGIMPEYAQVAPCKSRESCYYDELVWHMTLDPRREQRAAEMEQYYIQLAKWEEQVAEIEKEAALRKQTEERVAREAEPDSEAAADTSRPGAQPAQYGYPEDSPAGPTENGKSSVTGSLKRDVTVSSGSYNSPSNNQRTSNNQQPMASNKIVYPPRPVKPLTHKEYVAQRIENERLLPGFITLTDRRYLLRPEAIESVWYMYRITGDPSWQEKGWRMFEAVIEATRTDAGHSAIRDVTTKDQSNGRYKEDNMESFWLAETLKYFYLLFETPDVISLDEWVLNTEAHPFRRPR